MGNFHENLEYKPRVKSPSDFSFGITFSFIFLIFSLISYFKENYLYINVFIPLMLIFLFTSLIKPNWLRPFNIYWFKLSQLIHGLSQYLLLFIIFYLTLTPLSFLYRRFAKKDFHTHFDKNMKTYWLVKKNYSESYDSMKNQF
jgi:hypothetical protein